MQVNQVTVRYSLKKSVNFQSVGVDLEYSAKLEDGEDFNEAKQKLLCLCKLQTEEAVSDYMKEMKAK